jgi:multidrug efflux pump subunit AcrB
VYRHAESLLQRAFCFDCEIKRSDMVTQILNFGLPAPIDIQVTGRDLEGNRQWAAELPRNIRYAPGTADLRVQQPFDQPFLHFNIDRTKDQELGFTSQDIAQNLLASLSGSFQTAPTFWVDPRAVMTPSKGAYTLSKDTKASYRWTLARSASTISRLALFRERCAYLAPGSWARVRRVKIEIDE